MGAEVRESAGLSRDKRLVWVEPKGFRKGELKGAWKSVLRMIAAAVLVAVVVVCLSVWADLGVAAATPTLVSAGAIAIMCVAMWGVSHMTRITVKITSKAIVWTLGDISTKYRFEAIDHCEVREPGTGGEAGLLAVVLRNGDREVFGVAPSLSVDVLRSTLEQRGVRIGAWLVIGES
jgi:hypothetical protein